MIYLCSLQSFCCNWLLHFFFFAVGKCTHYGSVSLNLWDLVCFFAGECARFCLEEHLLCCHWMKCSIDICWISTSPNWYRVKSNSSKAADFCQAYLTLTSWSYLLLLLLSALLIWVHIYLYLFSLLNWIFHYYVLIFLTLFNCILLRICVI